MSEVTSPVQPNIVVMPQHSLRRRILCLGLSAVAALGIYSHVDEKIGLPNLGLPHFDLGDIFGGEAEPGQVTSEVLRESFPTEEEYEAQCMATVSAGAQIKGKKDFHYRVEIPFTNIGGSIKTGTAKVNKVTYGDADLCGDTGSVVTNAVVEGERVTTDGVTTTNVSRVTATTEGLTPRRARVDHTKWQNCVPTRYGDTPEKIEEKQENWQKDQKRKCDDGFDLSGAAEPEVVELSAMANTAAQVGLAVSEIPAEIMERQNARLKASIETKLRQIYPGAQVSVNVMPRLAEQQQARIDAEVENLRRNFYEVTVRKEFNPQTNRIDTTLHVVAPGGTEMDVKAGSVSAGDVSVTDFTKIREQALQGQQPAPSVTKTRKAA